MKFENGAVVMTDMDTGKPYARVLSAWELNLVLSQLQALDGETLKAREVVPFILRTPNVSEEKARRIAEKQAGLHHLAGQGTQALIDMAINARLPASLVHALQCERVRCTRCGKVCTRPGGEHLCGGNTGKPPEEDA